MREDVSMQQLVEGEYMEADEYRQWQISVGKFAVALIFLILARPPVHPTLRKGKEVETKQIPERSLKTPQEMRRDYHGQEIIESRY